MGCKIWTMGVLFRLKNDLDLVKAKRFAQKVKEEGLIIVKFSGKIPISKIVEDIKKFKIEKQSGVIIVHGGGIQIDERMRFVGREPKFDEKTGFRITNWETMRIVIDVINKINNDLVSKLTENNLPAVGFDLTSNVFHGCIIDDKHGRYGYITAMNASIVIEAVLNKKIAVMAPIGKSTKFDNNNIGWNEFGLNGNELNLNGDDAAVAMAAKLGIDKILLLSNTGLIINDKLISQIPGSSLKKLLENDRIKEQIGKGMIEKIHACTLAASLGISTIIANGMQSDSINNALEGKYETCITAQSSTGTHKPA